MIERNQIAPIFFTVGEMKEKQTEKLETDAASQTTPKKCDIENVCYAYQAYGFPTMLSYSHTPL